MKKNFKFLAVGCVALLAGAGLASCGGNGGGNKTITLVYSGAASDETFNRGLISKWLEAKNAESTDVTYNVKFVAHGADKVDSEVTDWSAAAAPDVYEVACDKLQGLYQKGALAELRGDYATYVRTEMNSFGVGAVTFNNKLVGFPYTGDNTYYLQYDKSVLTEDDVSSWEKLLAKCETLGKKIGYDLQTGFWGAAAFFTFGADYSIEFDNKGTVKTIQADFNTEKGAKAAKAISSIVKSSAWQNGMSAPTADNGLVGCIAGTWDISKYKDALGENYGCAVMPKITIDGEEKHMGAFLGGKLLGVNPIVSASDSARATAALDLAKYLTGTEAQLARFKQSGIAPCNKAAAANEEVQASPNIKVLSAQGEFAHAQTVVPAKFWEAPVVVVNAIVKGELDVNNTEALQAALDTMNNTIKTIA